MRSLSRLDARSAKFVLNLALLSMSVLAPMVSLGLSAEPPAGSWAAPDAAWDAAFTRERGWTGGDVVGALDLEDGRVLWSFGDTWIGKVAANQHVDSRLVNNTLAIQTKPADAIARAPAAGELNFYWGPTSEGQPQAWLAPAKPLTGDAASPAKDHWYWFTGGGVVARCPGAKTLDGKTPDGKPRLALFLFHIGKSGKEGVWGFESRGSVLATVDDFSGPPTEWRVEQHAIPFAVDAEAVRRDASLRETAWGMAAFREPTSDKDRTDGSGKPDRSHEVVYIYGVYSESSLDRRLLLARAPANELTDFSAWRFYAAGGRWSSSAAEAEPVATNVPTELSVERLRLGDQIAYVMVHSEPPLGGRVMLRVSRSPHGPWSAPVAIYSAPEIERDKRYFAYAAKGHAPLSAPGELLVSYVVNAHDFNAMVHDATIYRPRFVRAPLATERLAELLKNVAALPVGAAGTARDDR